MKQNTAILGIDIQNDFTTPTGGLFINGAERDVIRMASFIDAFGSSINYMALTLDSHQPVHISSQCYWKDREGYPPALHTNITADDVEAGEWTPQYNQNTVLAYLRALEAKGEVCVIWPPHCILGSQGWAFNTMFAKALYTWSVVHSGTYDVFLRGMCQTTEHYSIFKANIELQNVEETKFNNKLLNKLCEFDRIIVMGESADFCVSRSIADLLDAAPEMAERLVILTDCMSWVIPNNTKAEILFEKAYNMGVTFTTTKEYGYINEKAKVG